MPFLEYPDQSTPKNIGIKAVHYQLLDGILYKKDKSELYLKFLDKSKAYLAMLEMHEGTCRAYQAGRKMMWTLIKYWFFW